MTENELDITERKYIIKVNSVFRFFIVLISFFPVLISVMTSLNIEFGGSFWIIIPIVLAVFCAHFCSRGCIQLRITEKGIEQSWKTNFLFSKEENMYILWDRVDSFEYKPERTFDFYYINLKNNICFKFTRLNILWFKDDLKKFKKEFPKILEIQIKK